MSKLYNWPRIRAGLFLHSIKSELEFDYDSSGYNLTIPPKVRQLLDEFLAECAKHGYPMSTSEEEEELFKELSASDLDTIENAIRNLRPGYWRMCLRDVWKKRKENNDK